ncbi:MAG: hypothetical protein ACP5UQ_02935 [Anaerolineae bacterium]
MRFQVEEDRLSTLRKQPGQCRLAGLARAKQCRDRRTADRDG